MDCVIGGGIGAVVVVVVSTIRGGGGAVTVTAVVDAGGAVVAVVAPPGRPGPSLTLGVTAVRGREAIAPTIPAASRIAPRTSHSHRPGFGRGGATAAGAAARSISVGALVMLRTCVFAAVYGSVDAFPSCCSSAAARSSADAKRSSRFLRRHLS